jgi:hypothetical protein
MYNVIKWPMFLLWSINERRQKIAERFFFNRALFSLLLSTIEQAKQAPATVYPSTKSNEPPHDDRGSW